MIWNNILPIKYFISNENEIIKINGMYAINSLLNNNYLKVENNNLILSDIIKHFQVINIELNNYIILYNTLNKTLGIDINININIILYNTLNKILGIDINNNI